MHIQMLVTVAYDDGGVIEAVTEYDRTTAVQPEHPPRRHALARIRSAMRAAIQELKKG
jgi:hypothetical protein